MFYFGEDVLVANDEGDLVEAEDEWRAGVDDARPGIIMPGGTFILGARYYQEYAPEVALDRGENVEMGLSFAGSYAYEFENCVQVNDTNALEDPKGKEVDEKIYCPDEGLVMDEDAELVPFEVPD